MKYDKKEFKVDFTKGSGPGGQHRNKVETACTVTHIPTGTKQRCQESRSKITNYETAMKAVLSKLAFMEDQAKHNKLNDIRRNSVFVESNGSNVIRTYNFNRHEVKNHITGNKANLHRVLDGEIELAQQ